MYNVFNGTKILIAGLVKVPYTILNFTLLNDLPYESCT